MKFNINQTSEFARNAEIQFERGNIQTPAFMPVGTNGTVKGLTVEDLKSTDLREIGPTYYFAPPRVFEMQLTNVMIRMEDSGRFKKWLFNYRRYSTQL